MISVVVIYSENDEKYLQHLAESISFEHELILCKTIPSDFWRTERTKVDGHINYYNLLYNKNDFSFSKLRNHAKNLAKYEWILSLDADERLCCDTSEIKHIISQENAGGAYVRTVNYFQNKNNFDIFTQTRLSIFRKKYDYKYRVHENVIDSIIADGKEIIDTTIVVKHVGYLNQKVNEQKADRNTYLLCQDIVEHGINADRERRLYDTLNFKKEYTNGKFSRS